MLRKIEKIIRHQTGIERVFLCGSGTIGFLRIIESLNLQPSDEILIPDFICEIVAIPLLVKKIKFKVVDIEKDNVLPSLMEYQKNYSTNTKAILLAYIWGYVHKDLDKIIKWARKKNLIIIEDIASAYGLEYKGRKLGTLGDYCFGSFGKGKIVDFGSYGFYSLPANISLPPHKTILFREFLDYTSYIKKIRCIKNAHIRKFCFLFLAKLYPFYLNFNPDKKQLNLLYDKLLEFEKIVEQRQKNTLNILDRLKHSSALKIYIPNNDLKVASRVGCFCSDYSVFQKLQAEKCWIGKDFNYPISKLLNLETPHNTGIIIGKIFNILTEPQNITLSTSLNIICQIGAEK